MFSPYYVMLAYAMDQFAVLAVIKVSKESGHWEVDKAHIARILYHTEKTEYYQTVYINVLTILETMHHSN